MKLFEHIMKRFINDTRDFRKNAMVYKWKVDFLMNLKKQIGKPYVLGGGQMETYRGYRGRDEIGNWIGFDCCGGIMYSLKETTGIKLVPRNVPGMMNAHWLQKELKENELKEGDIIFVDIPTQDENGKVMRDENGYPIYGVFNHVMTYIGNDENGDIITTEGSGGDIRMNPQSKCKTMYWKFETFKKVSGRIFEDTTRYVFRRIDFDWLLKWKDEHKE